MQRSYAAMRVAVIERTATVNAFESALRALRWVSLGGVRVLAVPATLLTAGS
jgi:hypothetical protein